MADPDKYMYSRLELEELPEPDYFELETIYYEDKPPSLLTLAMKWTLRNLFLLFFLTLFLLASVLYITDSIPERPDLSQILRTSVASLKQTADNNNNNNNNLAQAQTSDGGGSIQIDVAGSDVLNTDGDDIVIDEGTVNISGQDGVVNATVTDDDDGRIVQIPSNATGLGNNDDNNNDNNNNDNNNNGLGSAGAATTLSTVTVTASSSSSSSQTAPPTSDGPASAQKPTQAEEPPEPFTPIRATFYSGVDGPSHCRGNIIGTVDMAKPNTATTTTTTGGPGPKTCYNFQNRQYAGCATFQANKVDGCIANVYEEPDCKTYMNTAAFMAEKRIVGGHFRSVDIQCGVPEPDPASLGKPPMVDQITGFVDNDKPAG